MALVPWEAEDDLVIWCTSDEGDVSLMKGLHGEGEGCGVCDGSGSKWPITRGLNRKGEQV
jgi:hypothetical protein